MIKSILFLCGVAAIICLQAIAVGLVLGADRHGMMQLCVVSLVVSAGLVGATLGMNALVSGIDALRRGRRGAERGR